MKHSKGSQIKPLSYGLSDKRRDRIFLMCGPLSWIFYLIFFAAAGFLPPIAPSMSAQDVASHYALHERGIKMGIYLIALIAFLWPLYGVAIHHQLARIPQVSSVVLILQLANSSALGIVFSLIAVFFAAASYRLDRDPGITQLANDLAWFSWGLCSGPLMLQFCAISWAILHDTRSTPLIPRWVAWTSLIFPAWMFFPFAAHCTYSGPFAWDGGVSFWGLWGTSAITFGPVTYYVWKVTGMVN
ncbi:hypothetical protein BDV34DRAFT_214159 [Aspergillus parasiticus]|uniref:Uncharacterized protein n=1 Tax=Aspergillus parasiticus TaxID=5067 RepID=A0A5N6DIT0_ASPPA|nr:hypothetical protein BDV34DRAFT_214159 [Aspergillus parasiticus]